MERAELEQRWSELAGRRDVGLVLACVRLYQRLDGRDRVYMLAGGMFITLVPLGIVLASAAGASGRGTMGERMVERLALTGAAEQSVLTLFTYPPGAVAGVTTFSLLLLLWSLNGFFGSVQRTFEGAWALPRRGWRGGLYRVAGAAVLLSGLVLVGFVGTAVRRNGAVAAVATLALQLVLLTGCWVVGTHLLLSRRVRRRPLLLGSTLSAALQLAAGWAAATVMPALFTRQTSRYGVIGAALALVTLLIILAFVIVAGAVIGSVLGRRDGATPLPATFHPERVRPEPVAPGTMGLDQVDTAERSVR